MLKHAKPNQLTLMSDRGTFSVGHLLRLKEHKFHAICSVPWGEVRNLFDHCYNSLEWSEASYLSMEQKRRREQNSSLPQEHYDIASTKHRFQDERSKEEIDCRVIFVYSTGRSEGRCKAAEQTNRSHSERLGKMSEQCCEAGSLQRRAIRTETHGSVVREINSGTVLHMGNGTDS